MKQNEMEWNFAAYTNLSVEAMVVDINLKSTYDCTLYGLYGWRKYPTTLNYDIKVVTRGNAKIVTQAPWNLPISYKDNRLQLTIYNERFTSGGYLLPLLMALSCQGI